MAGISRFGLANSGKSAWDEVGLTQEDVDGIISDLSCDLGNSMKSLGYWCAVHDFVLRIKDRSWESLSDREQPWLKKIVRDIRKEQEKRNDDDFCEDDTHEF